MDNSTGAMGSNTELDYYASVDTLLVRHQQFDNGTTIQVAMTITDC